MPTSKPSALLLDTNILLRFAVPSDPKYGIVVAALTSLTGQGANLYICPQNMQEYRQVATRPTASNGFGWPSEVVRKDIDSFEKRFTILPETPAIYPEWRRIAETVGAIGRANFDVRLVAIAAAADIDAILTFESTAFARYAACVPGLSVIDPANV